ncbi:MAG: hypothetical protein AVDCRST_MAG79-1507, partial [uncultured Thermoleophilia bacterium]
RAPPSCSTRSSPASRPAWRRCATHPDLRRRPPPAPTHRPRSR